MRLFGGTELVLQLTLESAVHPLVVLCYCQYWWYCSYWWYWWYW